MDRQIQEPSYRDGRLSAMAPLANPYVPFQMENPARYEAKKGLVRGTLFPGLDLPFMGMVNQYELPPTTLAELQSRGFAVQELALYLDTHREDQEALALYREYQQMYDKCRQLYIFRIHNLGGIHRESLSLRLSMYGHFVWQCRTE